MAGFKDDDHHSIDFNNEPSKDDILYLAKRARDLHAGLYATNYEDGEVAERAALDACHELDRIAYERGLIGDLATITSDQLVIPSLGYHSSTGSYDIITSKVEPSANPHQSDSSHTGEFFGFVPYTIRDEADPSIVRVGIACQVILAKGVVTPNFAGSLIASAPIDDAKLEFFSDKMRNDALEARIVLDDITDIAISAMIDAIEALLRDSKPFSQNILGEISQFIELCVIDDTLTPEQEDALLRLVKARLGLYKGEKFKLDVSSAFGTVATDNTSEKENYFVTGQIAGVIEFEELSFSPRYWIGEDGELHVDDETRAVSLLIETQREDGSTQIINVLLSEINLMEPLRGKFTAK